MKNNLFAFREGDDGRVTQVDRRKSPTDEEFGV